MSDERKLPEGRIGRLARLASVGVRTGLGLLRNDDGHDAAKKAADVLGTMRGVAAKLGQMASYVDGVIPEGQREAYELAMKSLRAAAPRSSSVEVRRLVEEELGAPIDRLFVEWNDTPFASASIGQVHRALLEDGREVAVKVQHPGVAKAIKSDLSNAGIVEGLATLSFGRRANAKDVMKVARSRFEEELDYVLEAERLDYFRRVHEGDEDIEIPDVVRDRSSRRVLTTRMLRGIDFEGACAAGLEQRRQWAETLWRFVFKGNLVGQHFNADPHPGNYIFYDGPRVGFLDFGCVQRIPDDDFPLARALHRAAIARDEKAFRAAGVKLLGAREGKLGDLALAYLRRCFAPLFESPFHMTRGYAASLVDEMKALGTEGRRARDDEFFAMPPDMLFMNRLQFGFYSVLARLDVEVDYARIEADFLPAEDLASP